MTTTEESTWTIRLPIKHVQDWCGRDLSQEPGCEFEVVSANKRYWVCRFNRAALAELISDATFYVSAMHGENTGGDDYASAAQRCLDWIAKADVAWERQGFSIRVLGEGN